MPKSFYLKGRKGMWMYIGATNTTRNNKPEQNILINYPKNGDLNLQCFYYKKGKVNFLQFKSQLLTL